MQETARKPYRLVTDSGAFIPADYNDLMRRSPVTAGNIMEKIIQTSEPLPVLSIPTPLLLRDGAVGLPALSWVHDEDTGRYRIGADNVGESVGGTLRYDWDATRCKFQILVHHPNGTVAAPALAFHTETGTGRYLVGVNNVGESLAGVAAFDWNSTRLYSATLKVYLGTGTPVTSADWVSVLKTVNGTIRYAINNDSAGASALSEYYSENDAGRTLGVGVRGSGWSGAPFNASDAYIAAGTGTDLQIYTPTGNDIYFLTGNTWRGTWSGMDGSLTLFYNLAFKITSSGAFTTTFSVPSLTGNRSPTIPDWDGQMMLGSASIAEGGVAFQTASGAYTTDLSKIYIEPTAFDLILGYDIWWKSGAGFYGVLAHSNTALRTYTFPDASGTIPLGTGAANQVAYWSAASALAGDAGLTYDSANDALTVAGWARIGSTVLADTIYDLAAGQTLNTQFHFDHSAGVTAGYDSTGALQWQIAHLTLVNTIFNSRGHDSDTIIRGDTDNDLIRADASTDRVGIGTSGPDAKLDVLSTSTQLRLTYTDGSVYADATLDSSGNLTFAPTGTIFYGFNKSSAGNNLALTVSNLDNTNSASHARLLTTSGGASGGDAYVHFLISGIQGWACGIDNSTSDSWKVSAANTLGTNDYLTIATTGATTIAQWLNVGAAGVAVAAADFASGSSSTNYSFWDDSASRLYLAGVGSQLGMEVINTGTGQSQVRLQRTGGTASDWYIYLPSASTNLRFFSTNDKYVFAIAGGTTVFNEQGEDIDTRIEGDTLAYMLGTIGDATTENIFMLTTAEPNWQSMDRGIFIGDVTTAPTGNPTAGGFIYSNAGAGTWRGSGGTTTTFAAAGPHCGACGYDFWKVCCVNETWGSELRECGWCGKVYKKGPASVLNKLTKEQRAEILN